jgi:hypothetical protein
MNKVLALAAAVVLLLGLAAVSWRYRVMAGPRATDACGNPSPAACSTAGFRFGYPRRQRALAPILKPAGFRRLAPAHETTAPTCAPA